MQIQTTTKPASPAVDSFSQQDLQLYKECEAETSSSETLPQALVDAFAAATGWELGLVGEEVQVVDMSADWPANRPTAHRGNCDRLAEELSRLLRR